MTRKYEYGYKGDKRHFDHDLYPRRCEIVDDTIVVYDMEFDRICHVMAMKYLDNVETGGQNISVLSYNCDRVTISNTTSARGANFLAEVIEEEIEKVHKREYGNHRQCSSSDSHQEGCCGYTGGADMAEMSLASCEPGPGM